MFSRKNFYIVYISKIINICMACLIDKFIKSVLDTSNLFEASLRLTALKKKQCHCYQLI